MSHSEESYLFVVAASVAKNIPGLVEKYGGVHHKAAKS